ncbi:hypothetical protein J2X69_003346 [Algoriphagus sp. 4150]|uniref:DUF6520 family protein n=1 Tax=Algoriphagus sp. 4150 TaxID=2817756 RepID=UPI0028610301|nr:DUF6520 family protein [Algoriphagus sp. 4150]MDR7130987.1 hypothetical protein [Algoriphagus sp. 4150]
MKSLKNLLPALGLVFGATLAMAMNFAEPTFVEQYRPVGGSSTDWYDLTNVTPGPSTYQCNDSSIACTYSEPDINSPMVESGVFQKNGDLPILED